MIITLELLIELLLICKFDRFHTDPSGSYWETSAKAIGSGSEGADTALTDQYNRVRNYNRFCTYTCHRC